MSLNLLEEGNIRILKQKCGNTEYVDTLSFAVSVNNAVEMSAIWNLH